MIALQDIRSLTDFQRNTQAQLRRLKSSGRPAVLTVNGRAELIVQDAAAFEDMLDAIRGIQRGLDEMKAGTGKPFRQALDEIRAVADVQNMNFVFADGEKDPVLVLAATVKYLADFQVPANRWGSNVFSPYQLKIIQEIITLAVFVVFALFYFKTWPTWNQVAAFVCILAAVAFAFLPKH